MLKSLTDSYNKKFLKIRGYRPVGLEKNLYHWYPIMDLMVP